MGLESLIPKRDDSNSTVPQKNAGFSLPQARQEPPFAEPIREQIAASIRSAQNLKRLEPVDNIIAKQAGRKNEPSHESVFHIEVEKIKPNPYQPRKVFNKEELDELSQSIREFGVIQPVVVSKLVTETETGADVEYQLIAGERRLMAAKLAGLERIPAIIRQGDSKQSKLELALIENIQRSNLNPLESARAYARLAEEFNMTQREIATRVGKSREAVANTMRLLSLPSEIQASLATGAINESHARVLLAVADPREQREMFIRLVSGEGMSVQTLRTKTKTQETVDPETQHWKKKLEEFFGAPVDVTRKGAGGKLVVQFYSDEEWQSIIDRLFGNEEAV